MAETGDLINEFKSAKPAEKIVIVGGVLAALGIVWYLHNKGSGYTSSTAGQTSGQSSLQSGFPTIPQGSTPVLPYGTNPLYDPNGNLVGFQNSAPSTPTSSPPISGNPIVGGTVPTGPLIPYAFFSNHQFPTQQGKPYANVKTFSYGGTTYNIQPGKEGRIWGTPTNGGSQVLLYGPPSAYVPKQGGGAFGTRVGTHHGVKTSPSKEGQPYVAKVYRRRV